MAGWADSGSSRGRGGGGGGGFANRAGANNMNTRWRARTPAAQNQQQQHQQHQQHPHQQNQQHPHQQNQQHQYQQQQHQHQQHQQHRYRPVNENDQSSQHPHHPPAEEPNRHRGQVGFSNSTRRPQPQPTHPPHARPTSTDHKSPAPATNANANANAIANEPDDKARRNAANFECNVCFDMADDPVVTKCGHLFCWECLYQWLHVHSHHRECPVCKGQVADDAIIPIYGRGGSAASVNAAPPRPAAARVESARQQAALDGEDDNPFGDLFGLQLSSLSAMMSFMPDLHTDSEEYEDYINPYQHNRYDELDHFDLSRFQVPASAAAGSSRRHFHHTGVSSDITDSFFDNTNHQEPDFVYRGGRRQRGRARAAASADHSNFVELGRGAGLVMGGSSSVSYRDTGAGPHINNAGGSSRPNGGWAERRGRSNRSSNSGAGREMQNNSRRQGANYN